MLFRSGYLEAALNSRKIPDDAWFYYARSLFYSGQYANAQAAFTRYLSTDDRDKLKVASANNYVHNCESALELNKSRKAVAVVNEREISAANFFSNYEFSSGKGRVAPVADQFVTDVDGKSDESSTMFISGDNQFILLAKQVKGSSTGKDIYIVKEQANGMWSAPVLVGSAVN